VQIEIDPVSDVPLYQQLHDRVVEAIADGVLVPGEQLASVRTLALAFGINVATVGKGYDLLRHEGLIRTNQKSGSVVARGPLSGAPSTDFLEDWRIRARTLMAEAIAHGASSAQLLEATGSILARFSGVHGDDTTDDKVDER
jgi:DNA-binding transcriptional regulator YhcF (GntR family)